MKKCTPFFHFWVVSFFGGVSTTVFTFQKVCFRQHKARNKEEIKIQKSSYSEGKKHKVFVDASFFVFTCGSLSKFSTFFCLVWNLRVFRSQTKRIRSKLKDFRFFLDPNSTTLFSLFLFKTIEKKKRKAKLTKCYTFL